MWGQVSEDDNQKRTFSSLKWAEAPMMVPIAQKQKRKRKMILSRYLQFASESKNTKESKLASCTK